MDTWLQSFSTVIEGAFAPASPLVPPLVAWLMHKRVPQIGRRQKNHRARCFLQWVLLLLSGTVLAYSSYNVKIHNLSKPDHKKEYVVGN
jgi:hypothetical protein